MKFKTSITIFKYVCVLLRTYECIACEVQKRALDPLEIQSAVSHPMWELGIELRSSTQAEQSPWF